MYKLILGAALIALAGAVSADDKDITGQIPVDDSFGEYTYRTTGKPPYGHVRYKLAVIDGMIELCGAYAITDGQLHQAVVTFQEARYLVIDGKKRIEDFTYFTRVKRVRDFKTAMANCKSTGVKYVNGKEYDIQFEAHGRRFVY